MHLFLDIIHSATDNGLGALPWWEGRAALWDYLILHHVVLYQKSAGSYYERISSLVIIPLVTILSPDKIIVQGVSLVDDSPEGVVQDFNIPICFGRFQS